LRLHQPRNVRTRLAEMNDTNYRTGMKAQQQLDERELVIDHLQKLFTERQETIESLRAELNSVRMSAGRLLLRKLSDVYERAVARVSARLRSARSKGAARETVARTESLDAAKALLDRGRAALKELRGDDVRAVAFYLPQFHPIPENDRWWGKGFTEWTNVTKARPNFEGHYQPHLPADLGFYDLRVPEAREQQAELAREYGIHGFCYYHYWLGGRRLLERAFNEVLSSGRPDFPFCLCWANHNWTRCWDGGKNEILIAQRHSAEDDRNLIRSLFPAFEDRRYIRVNGKPLFIVFRASILPNVKQTAAIWREEMKRAGLGEIYLCLVQSDQVLDPRPCMFDAAIEFPPLGAPIKKLDARIAGADPNFAGSAYDYMLIANAMVHKPKPDYALFRGVMPGWDNTPRRQDTGCVYINSSPEAYEYWLGKAVEHMIINYKGDERMVFINAWNEWGEGAHLEPDRRYGRRYLEATRNVLSAVQGSVKSKGKSATLRSH
jgi:lipopolysaccharide biosynthesis protein